jgi:hypothetical protein
MSDQQVDLRFVRDNFGHASIATASAPPHTRRTTCDTPLRRRRTKESRHCFDVVNPQASDEKRQIAARQDQGDHHGQRERHAGGVDTESEPGHPANRYAVDFVVTVISKEVLGSKVLPAVIMASRKKRARGAPDWRPFAGPALPG